MKTKTKLALIIIVIVALVTAGTVAAQTGEPTDPTPTTLGYGSCPEGMVSGTVVDVDEDAATVLILTTDQTTGEPLLCTVSLGAAESGEPTKGHPIVALLGAYFGRTFDETVDNLKDSMESPEGCVVSTGNPPTYAWIDCAGSEPNARIVAIENDTVSVLLLDAEGNVIGFADIMDSLLADEFDDQLSLPTADWEVDGQGNVLNTADDIEALHEEGLGFGVIVKLYSLAQRAQEQCLAQATSQESSQSEDPNAVDPCTMDVNYLVEQFKTNHIGLGQLYKLTGLEKPDLLGVGHVRKADMTNGDGDGDNGEGETPTSTKFQGLGRGHGNTPMTPPGLAKKNQDTSTETTVQEPSSSSSHPGKGKGPAKDNPGKGNGKGKSKGKGKP